MTAALDLNGGWKVAVCESLPADGTLPELASLDWIPARVPRAVHYDLMEAGRLENVFASSKASESARWVSETDWVYLREYDLTPGVQASARRLLKFHCVDTFSDVFLNGLFVGSTANMFTPYSFELDAARLRSRGNVLVVHVKAHARMVAPKAAEAAERIALDSAPDFARVRSLVRRYQRSFNADMIGMGFAVIGIGIPRAVEILGLPAAFIDDHSYSIESLSGERAVVVLDVDVDDRRTRRGELSCRATLDAADGASTVCTAAAPVMDARCRLSLVVPDPRLWWPAGYGAPHLYRLHISLESGGETVHELDRTLGLRTIELVRETPDGRRTFFFRINGTRVHVRGGNLIPIDYLNGCGTVERNAEMLRLAVGANMNMVRLWGGGTLEEEAFLDECDRLGIMVWKDFHLHSHTYPDYDEAFVEEVRRESIVLAKALRKHACFTVVCGANETQEGWDGWGWRDMVDCFYGSRLTNNVLKKVAAEHCAEVPYVPDSPHGAKLAQSPVDGDTHTWGNFFNATKDPQFVTETCWFSGTYSRPETLEACMGIKVDDFAGFRWHRKWKARTGLALANVNQYSEYHPLGSLRDYMRGLEIEMMRADTAALSLLRCRSPSCNGIIYWPLNKGGPFFNFGCIDYLGRPLMSYYALKRLFAGVAVNVYRDLDDIRIVAANSGRAIPDARLLIRHLDSGGTERERIEAAVSIAAGNSVRLYDLDGFYRRIQDRWREVVHVRLEKDGRVLSEDTLFFCPWYEFEVTPGNLRCTGTGAGAGKWELEIASSTFAKMVAVESETRIVASDNYFTLPPGRRTISLTALDPVESGVDIRVESLDAPDPVELRLH